MNNIAWIAVNKDGSETIFAFRPFRTDPNKSLNRLWEPEYWTDEGVSRYGNEDTGIVLLRVLSRNLQVKI